MQNSLITPTTKPGNTRTTVYTVVVTPNITGCAISKKLAIVAASLLVPTMTPVAPICKSSTNVALNAVPAGGVFNAFNNQITNSKGFVTPGFIGVGSQTVIYTKQFT